MAVMDEKLKRKQDGWCCKYNLFGVTLIAFGISMLLFLPDYIHNQITQVSNRFPFEIIIFLISYFLK